MIKSQISHHLNGHSFGVKEWVSIWARYCLFGCSSSDRNFLKLFYLAKLCLSYLNIFIRERLFYYGTIIEQCKPFPLGLFVRSVTNLLYSCGILHILMTIQSISKSTSFLQVSLSFSVQLCFASYFDDNSFNQSAKAKAFYKWFWAYLFKSGPKDLLSLCTMYFAWLTFGWRQILPPFVCFRLLVVGHG